MKQISRRQTLAGIGAAAASAALPWRVLAQAKDPIRIGYLAPLSGASEVIGRDQLIGAQIAVDQINKEGGLMGRQVELVVRDDGSKPDRGVAVVRELVGSGINLIVGIYASPVTLAVADTLKDLNALLMTQCSALTSLTYEKFTRNLFRPTEFSLMRQRGIARLAAMENPQLKSFGCVTTDIATQIDAWNLVHDGLLEYFPAMAGHAVDVAEPVRMPAGAADYRTQISRAMGIRADALYVGMHGGDVITFLKQQKAYRLLDRFQMAFDAGSEYFVPKTMKKETPKDYWTAIHWYAPAYAGNKISDDLYKEAVTRTGGDKYPQGYLAEAHTAVRALATGIQKAQSTDTETLISAMEGMSFETCKGTRTFRKEDHQADADVNYIRFGPADNEDGWEVTKYQVVKGVDTIPPASPGKAFELTFLAGAGIKPLK